MLLLHQLLVSGLTSPPPAALKPKPPSTPSDKMAEKDIMLWEAGGERESTPIKVSVPVRPSAVASALLVEAGGGDAADADTAETAA